MSAQQPEPAKVRVAEPETATAEDKKDYQFLLEENLQLLRDADKVKGLALTESKKVQALQKELEELKTKDANRGVRGYRLGRRIVLGVHVVLSIMTGLSGLILWLKGISEPAACLMAIPGLIWLGIITSVIYGLAEEEPRS